MRTRVILLSVGIWLSGMVSATAWSRAGHELVARIAWNRLDEQGKGCLYTVLRHHPAFREWQHEAEAAASAGAAMPADPRLFIVQRAAAWPDDIRRRGADNPFRLEDPSKVHGDWHYVDHPLTFDGTRCPTTLPQDNVLKGLRWANGVLSTPTADIRERAIALAWLLHLVGDIHQPLHCAERYSQALPKGDRGGNEWQVRLPDGRELNLHWMWDSLADQVGDASTKECAVRKLDEEKGPDVRFEQWSLEGAQIARVHVYEKGAVPGAPIKDSHAPPRNVPALTQDYLDGSLDIARHRLWLAGGRLGDILCAYWPPNETSSPLLRAGSQVAPDKRSRPGSTRR